MALLHVDIVTPEKIVFSGSASEVRVPGALGEFGVLPDHAAFLSLLRPGPAVIVTPEGNKRFVIGRGFAEAGGERVVVLTEHCEIAGTVDHATAQKQLEEAERQLVLTAAGSEERLQAEQAADMARGRLA